MSNDVFPRPADLFLDRRLRFYLTGPSSCPYLPDRIERKLFTTLDGPDAHHLNETLTIAGFRRSQNIAYRPACDGCNECVSIRINVEKFEFDKKWRRILSFSKYVYRDQNFPEADEERYALLKRYLNSRHHNQGMSDMNGEDFISMIEECTLNTRIADYRLKEDCEFGKKDALIASILLDEMEDGKSLVYSFFEPDLARKSLGSFLILDQILDTKNSDRHYLYLGYLIKDCRKMQYKARFKPFERLGRNGWAE